MLLASGCHRWTLVYYIYASAVIISSSAAQFIKSIQVNKETNKHVNKHDLVTHSEHIRAAPPPILRDSVTVSYIISSTSVKSAPMSLFDHHLLSGCCMTLPCCQRIPPRILTQLLSVINLLPFSYPHSYLTHKYTRHTSTPHHTHPTHTHTWHIPR